MLDLNAFRVFDGGEVEFFIPRAQFVGVGLERGQLGQGEFELQERSRAVGEGGHHWRDYTAWGKTLQVWMGLREYNSHVCPHPCPSPVALRLRSGLPT